VNSSSFRTHCVKVHVRYLIFWWVLVDRCSAPWCPCWARNSKVDRIWNNRSSSCHPPSSSVRRKHVCSSAQCHPTGASNLEFDRFWSISPSLPTPSPIGGKVGMRHWTSSVSKYHIYQCIVTPAGREIAHLTKSWILGSIISTHSAITVKSGRPTPEWTYTVWASVPNFILIGTACSS